MILVKINKPEDSVREVWDGVETQKWIVSNLQNQSMTDRQTDRQDDYYNLSRMCTGS